MCTRPVFAIGECAKEIGEDHAMRPVVCAHPLLASVQYVRGACREHSIRSLCSIDTCTQPGRQSSHRREWHARTPVNPSMVTKRGRRPTQPHTRHAQKNHTTKIQEGSNIKKRENGDHPIWRLTRDHHRPAWSSLAASKGRRCTQSVVGRTWGKRQDGAHHHNEHHNEPPWHTVSSRSSS